MLQATVEWILDHPNMGSLQAKWEMDLQDEAEEINNHNKQLENEQQANKSAIVAAYAFAEEQHRGSKAGKHELMPWGELQAQADSGGKV
jgi:hypothetical protein